MAIRGTRTTIADHDPAADAREAARRAGMSLGDWLDAVVESRMRPALHGAPDSPAPDWTRHPAAAVRDADRLADRVGKGMDTDPLERRLGRLVGSLGSNVEMRREDAPKAMDAIASRLERLRDPARPDKADRRANRDTIRHLEERLQAIARRMQSGCGDVRSAADLVPDPKHQRPPLVPSRPAPAAFDGEDVRSRTPIGGLKEAIAEVAARQRTLESEFERAVGTYADRVDHRMDAVAERLEHRFDEAMPASRPRATHDDVPAGPAAAGPDQAGAMAELLAIVGRLAQRIEAIPGRLGDTLAVQLEDTVRRLDTATRTEIDAIRGELREIAHDLDRNTRTELEALRSEITRLAGQIAVAPAMPVEVEARIADIADRLDTAARSEFGALRAEIRSLAEQLERSERYEFETLRGDLRELGERLSKEYAETSSRGADDAYLADLDAIRSEIRNLSTQIDAARRAGDEILHREMQLLDDRISAAPERVGDLERHLVALSEQLAAAAADDDPETLAQLERKIALLAENVEESARSMADIGSLERTIGDLSARIEENKADALQAARDAARDAVERASQPVPGDDGADIPAVHETLKAILDRLDDLEDGIPGPAGAARTRQAAPTGPADEADARPMDEIDDDALSEVDPDDLVARIDAVARNFQADDGPRPDVEDTPLVPGTRQPKTTFAEIRPDHAEPGMAPLPASSLPASSLLGADLRAAAAAPGAAGGLDDAGQLDKQPNFVAAARRAVRAAAAGQIDPDRLSAGRARPGLKGPRSGFGRYQRSLPIAAAMVVIIFGAFEISTYVQTDSGVLATGNGSAPQRVAAEKRKSDRSAGEAAPAAAGTDKPAPVQTARSPEPGAGEPTGSIADKPDSDPSASASIPDAARQDGPIPTNLLPAQLRAAAEADDATAQFEIADRYMDGRGLPQSDAMAADWYRKAAAQGLAPAQYRLGSLYEKGQGISRDLSMARMWYQRAAEQGNRNAMHNLAVLYADGVDGAPDYEKAATWFRKAAEYGLGDSQFNLAVLYARGLGVQADLGESYRWFAIAASQGDSEALQKRDEIARNLDEETLEKARAAADAWVPRPPEPGANVVSEPPGGWGDERPAKQTLITREMVVAAQSLLNDLGYGAGPADGEIGPRTRDAVRAFQRSVGLPDTGDISPELIGQLGGAAG